MNNVKYEKERIFNDYIKDNKGGLEMIGLNTEDIVNNNITFEEAENSIGNVSLGEIATISKGVGYIQGYEEAILRIRDHFSNIVSAEDAQGGGRKIYTSLELEEMFSHLLK